MLGADGSYVELEVGPHGHWLALRLAGRRQIVGELADLTCRVERNGARWTARVSLDVAEPPPRPWRFNAYAIHGVADGRRYLAHFPVPGERPDFHRLECFGALEVDL